MNNQKDITEIFGTLYHPKSALVFYEAEEKDAPPYVEHFDMDKNGNPINAHPLTVKEAKRLAKDLNVERQDASSFLKPEGLMGTNILQVDPSYGGVVIWFTKATTKELYFVENLGIPNGTASIPPLLWVANKEKVFVFALKSGRRPTINTILHHAPFFNIYADGKVCMGTVDVKIKKSSSLKEFTDAWESYFFGSYFSHLMNNHNPIKGNCVSLWKKLIETGVPFPTEVLLPCNKKLKDVLR